MGKKDNKSGSSKKIDKTPSKKSSFPFARIFALLISVLVGVSSYYVYYLITTTPPVPNLDLNEWWGPYPIKQNQDLSVRPFKIEFSEVMVNDLRERLLHRRASPPPLEGAGFTYGFNSNFLTQVLDYWKNKYNFQEREKFLNKYDQFKTNIQGLDIHFLRVKPKVEEGYEVVPLLMLHGWPGSVREFYEVIPKLTTPRPGYKFVFEVIAPSLPGYGFSQGAVRPGLGSGQVAVVMRNLMRRLGFTKYYVQGGDWGSAIGSNMATLFPNELLGLHLNTPYVLHPMAAFVVALGSIWPNWIEESAVQDRLYPMGSHFAFTVEESGYMHLQATKPDTIGVCLTDSPAGLAAYILEKFSTWTNRDFKKAADGNLLKKYSLTHLLDNVMIYWSTNSITTSMRLYAETLSSKHFALQLERVPTYVPTWGLKCKHEILHQPDIVLRLKFKNYLRSTIVEDGGHFAAFEVPDIVADDVFEAVDTFKQFHKQSNKSSQDDTRPNDPKPSTIYDFTVRDINGNDVKLDKYRGQVTLIVNVASQCGLTQTNYEQLNQLHNKYFHKGLRILAFPCNQFGGQEPGTAKDILTFTKAKSVEFDLFEKVEVNGENAHPLWKFLKEKQSGTITDAIKWNFSKFIVDKNGVPVERLASTTQPLDLEPLLNKYL